MQRLTRQEGFVLPATLLLLLVAGLVTAAAFAAVSGDLPIAKADQSRRSALDAAQAGSAWYAAKLAADPDYWTKCGTVSDPDGGTTPPVSGTPWNGTGPDPRKFRAIPGGQGSYTIELLPANGNAACSTSDPAGSMLTANRLRIRSTGIYGTKKRSLITTFRRPSFLDYVYFTNYEVTDPSAITPGARGADAGCANYYNGATNRRGLNCSEIQWVTGDSIAGPLHTNDMLNVCGTPVFGRTSSDRIETSDPAGSRSDCGDNRANIKGLPLVVPPLARPPDNQSLKLLATSPYQGSTQLIFAADGYKFRNASNYPNLSATQPYPANGLIYVASTSGSCPASTIYQKYDLSDTACGNAYVSGTYPRNLTVAAANDVVVVDDLTRANPDAMMGLVANNFVRIFHPVTGDTSAQNSDGTAKQCAATNATVVPKDPYYGQPALVRGALPWKDPTIQAGILAINHSFIVDNYPCGAASELGTLHVNGAIAQEFRGPVGSTFGSFRSGYVKDYSYDDRFAYRQPPNFLDPVRAAWILARQNEQQPAT